MILCIVVHNVAAEPCGSGSFCNCYDQINLITCAAKGLTDVPEMTMANRRMCKILILDHNNINSLSDFKLSEWPQLEEIRLRKNPGHICDWIYPLRLESNGKLTIVHDCVEEEKTEALPRSKVVIVETSAMSPTTLEITTHTKTNRPVVKTKKPGNVNHECVESYDEVGMSTEPSTETVETTTSIDSENVTSAMSWGIDMSMTRDKLAVIISVPVSIFGVGLIILVKLMWRRNGGPSYSFDVKPKYRSAGNSHEQMEMTGKKKNSPTPSMESVNSDVMFDSLAMRRNSAVNHRSALSGIYLNS